MPPRTIQRYTALDGLRGVAAYLVVVSHYISTPYPTNVMAAAGQVGVMLFFVISGFLMGELYMKTPFTKEAVRAFYVKRFARVVPLYYVVVIVSLVLFVTRKNVWPLYYVDPPTIWQHLLFWRGTNVLWTIPVEVQFYALFPLIWWAFSRAGTAAMLLLVVACATGAASWIPTNDLFTFFLPYFAAGLLLSVITVPYSRLIEFLVIPAFIVLMLAMPKFADAMGVRQTGVWNSPVYLLLVPTTVLLVVNSRWAAIVLGSRVAAFTGMISYSVYLLHMPVHFVLRQLPIFKTSPLLFIGVAVIGTTVVAWLSYRLIENPARRWVSRFAYARPPRLITLIPRQS